MNATATTLSAGSQATATITNSGDSHNANYALALGIPQGIQGERGVQGERGERGERGEQGIQGIQGIQGETGEAFSIYKTYPSVADMNADASNVPEGKFTLIASNVGDPDNSKLFVKNGEGTFTYLTDMSGAQGIQGERGEQGVQGIQGIQGVQGETGPRGSVKSQYVAELPASGDEDTFYLVDRDLESHTESGEYITLETTQTAAAIQSAQIGGNATQADTPTPSAPVAVNTVTGENTIKITGKNLFDADDFLTKAGVTYTKSSGNYSITAWGNLITIRYPLATVAGGTYTISLSPIAQGTSNARIQVRKDGSVVGEIYAGTDNPNHSYTFTADSSAYTLNATYSSPFNSPVVFSNPQLEFGNQATSYQAYTAQDYEVNLGKNLSTVASRSNVTWPAISSDLKNIVNSLPVGTYTISMVFTLTTRNDVTDSSTFGIGLPNSGGNLQKNDVSWGASAVGGSKDFAFTIDITSARQGNFSSFQLYGCGINGTGATGKADISNIQIERGDTATSYAPYFTPIELAKIGTYQDRIYKTDGKWYVEKNVGKVVLDGTENWTGAGSGFYIDSVTDYLKTGNKPFCDYFTTTTNVPSAGQVSDGTLAFGASNLVMARLYVKYTSLFSSVSDLTTWLQSHNTTVYYALATPTTTEITDQTLIDQLEALASATLGYGVNNIWTEIATGNAMPTLELNWVEWEKYNRHNVYIWNDDIDDWQIIVGMDGES